MELLGLRAFGLVVCSFVGGVAGLGRGRKRCCNLHLSAGDVVETANLKRLAQACKAFTRRTLSDLLVTH